MTSQTIIPSLLFVSGVRQGGVALVAMLLTLALIITRHLRRIAIDRLTGEPDWEAIRGRLLSAPFGLPESAVTNGMPVEGIVGIYSRSRKKPVRAMDAEGRPFASYAEWLFTIPADFTRIQE